MPSVALESGGVKALVGFRASTRGVFSFMGEQGNPQDQARMAAVIATNRARDPPGEDLQDRLPSGPDGQRSWTWARFDCGGANTLYTRAATQAAQISPQPTIKLRFRFSRYGGEEGSGARDPPFCDTAQTERGVRPVNVGRKGVRRAGWPTDREGVGPGKFR
jgi:hypothetical protein